MNKVIVLGRLTKDVEIVQVGDTVKGIFTLASRKSYKKKNEETFGANFIPCEAWGRTAENISQYFKKGNMILVEGELDTDSYTNANNEKVYTWVLRVDSYSFTGEKNGDATATE